MNYPLSIDRVSFSTLITERENEVRLSFRSQGDFDVNEFAREHFNGGGHKKRGGLEFRKMTYELRLIAWCN